MTQIWVARPSTLSRVLIKFTINVHKPIPFSLRSEKELLSEKKSVTKYFTILEKSQKASYEVTYVIAKEGKTHTIRETLIKHAAIAISQIMNVGNLTEEIKGITMSADTLRRRISEMAGY